MPSRRHARCISSRYSGALATSRFSVSATAELRFTPLRSELADWLWDCSVARQRSELSGLVHNPADSERRGSLMPGKRYEGEDSTQGAIEGKYANYFQIGHNAFEFLLDF